MPIYIKIPSAALAHDDITSINQRLSRLLKLPTEIRNEIYHYVFNDTILPVHQMQILRRHQRPSQVNKLEPAIHSSLSLLLVSRQLHYAARPAIFSSCLFDLSSLKWPRRAAPILGNKACDLIHYIEINQIVLANIRHSNNTQSCFPRLKGIRVRCHMPDDFNIPWIVQTVQILHWFFNRKELLIVFLDDAGQICYVSEDQQCTYSSAPTIEKIFVDWLHYALERKPN